MFSAPVKDPQAVLDYAFDWSAWLAEGEIITAHDATAGGVRLDSASRAGAVVTVWVSGGIVGSRARITCEITTNAGRTDQRSLMLDIAER